MLLHCIITSYEVVSQNTFGWFCACNAGNHPSVCCLMNFKVTEQLLLNLLSWVYSPSSPSFIFLRVLFFFIIPNNGIIASNFNFYHIQFVHQCKGTLSRDVQFAQNDEWQGEMVFHESAVTHRIFVSFRAFHGYSASFPSRMLESPLTRIKIAMLTSFPVSARWELDFHILKLLDYSLFHLFIFLFFEQMIITVLNSLI